MGGRLEYRRQRARLLLRRPPRLAAQDPAHTQGLTERIWLGEYDRRSFVPRRGWRVLDIGANVGAWTLLAAKRGARVTAVEPAPRNAEFLRHNTAGTGVTIIEAAVMPTGGRTRLFLSDADTRHTVLGADQRVNTPLEEAIQVPAIAFAELLEEPWDLVKMDCEGAEHQLLAAISDQQLILIRRLVAELHGTESQMAATEARLRFAGFHTIREPLEHERLSLVFAKSV